MTASALSDSQIRKLAHYTFEGTNTGLRLPLWWFQVDLHGGVTSALSRIGNEDTAYPHREKLFLFQFFDTALIKYPRSGFKLVQGFRKSITDELEDGDWGMYANYADTEVSSFTAQRLYWGNNLQKLQKIKRQLDPEEVFANPQSITPSS